MDVVKKNVTFSISLVGNKDARFKGTKEKRFLEVSNNPVIVPITSRCMYVE